MSATSIRAIQLQINKVHVTGFRNKPDMMNDKLEMKP